MTDEDILEAANKVFAPAGLSDVHVRRPPSGYQLPVAITVIFPDKERTHFHISVQNGESPLCASLIGKRCAELIGFIVKTTSTWPTPWVPAMGAD